MRHFTAAAVGVALLAVALSAQTASVTPEKAMANLEKAIKAVTTLQADFEQLHYSMSVSEPLREKGQLFLEMGDKARPNQPTFEVLHMVRSLSATNLSLKPTRSGLWPPHAAKHNR